MSKTKYVSSQSGNPNQNILDDECKAIKLLKWDGWTVGEIALSFGVVEDTIYYHINGDCSHKNQLDIEHVEYPMRDDVEQDIKERRDEIITNAECDAMSLVSEAGWTLSEVKMVFHVSSYGAAKNHVESICAHNRVY